MSLPHGMATAGTKHATWTSWSSTKSDRSAAGARDARRAGGFHASTMGCTASERDATAGVIMAALYVVLFGDGMAGV